MNIVILDQNGVKHCYFNIDNLKITGNYISFDFFLGHTLLNRKYFSLEEVYPI